MCPEMHEGLDDEIGLITMDASFSPVRKVAYMVEQARVGQMTNYDKLLALRSGPTAFPRTQSPTAPRF